MDSKKLGILITAVDLGSFTKAAEVVGYTQSGLTHLVDGIEREIGVRLINRDHSGISLTDEGKLLMPAIRDFLRANANLENSIKSITENKPQTIRIAAYSSIAMHWMPEILYRFRRKCPDVDVDLRMVDNALEPFELLEAGKTDVVFASRQSCENCEWTHLYDEKMFAILPKDYPINGRKSFPISEFEKLDFIMPYGKFDIDVNPAFGKAGVSLHYKASYVDDETVIRMVGHGLGVSMMTELMIRGRTDDVLCIPIQPDTIRALGMGINRSIIKRKSIADLRVCVLDFISDYVKKDKA